MGPRSLTAWLYHKRAILSSPQPFGNRETQIQLDRCETCCSLPGLQNENDWKRQYAAHKGPGWASTRHVHDLVACLPSHFMCRQSFLRLGLLAAKSSSLPIFGLWRRHSMWAARLALHVLKRHCTVISISDCLLFVNHLLFPSFYAVANVTRFSQSSLFGDRQDCRHTRLLFALQN